MLLMLSILYSISHLIRLQSNDSIMQLLGESSDTCMIESYSHRGDGGHCSTRQSGDSDGTRAAEREMIGVSFGLSIHLTLRSPPAAMRHSTGSISLERAPLYILQIIVLIDEDELARIAMTGQSTKHITSKPRRW